MSTRVWSTAAGLVAGLALGAVVLHQQGGSEDNTVPVRAQATRHSILVHGQGSPVAVTGAARQDAARFVEQNGGNLQEVLAAGTVQGAWDRAVDDLGPGYVASGPGLGLIPGDRLDDGHWVLLSARPTAIQLARLERLPVDVRVFFGDTISTDQERSLGSRAGGLLEGRLTEDIWESGFGSGYDTVVVTYRPPVDATDADLDAAEHAVLVDLADDQPDHRLPFPVSFVRDPDLTETGTAQRG